MRYLWSIICLLALSNSYASEDTNFDGLTWKAIVMQSVACLDGDSDATEETKIIEQGTNNNIPILTLTAMEHDLLEQRKPAFLFFQTSDNAYKLCDSDGGATLCLLYAICMTDLRRMMKAKEDKMASNAWSSKSKNLVRDFKKLKFLIRHSITRIISTYAVEGSFKIKTTGLQDFLQAMNQNDVTYDLMYKFIGKWFLKNYDRLPHYRIEVTNFNTGLTKAVNGIRYCESLKDPNWTPLANTFRFLCRMQQFEQDLPHNRGVYELEVKDMDTILKLYEIERSFDQGLFSDYTAIKTVSKGPRGEIIETTTWVPTKENPQVAIGKHAKSATNNRSKKKSV